MKLQFVATMLLPAARTKANKAEQKIAEAQDPSGTPIKPGLLTIGGAMRVNYVNGEVRVSSTHPPSAWDPWGFRKAASIGIINYVEFADDMDLRVK